MQPTDRTKHDNLVNQVVGMVIWLTVPLPAKTIDLQGRDSTSRLIRERFEDKIAAWGYFTSVWMRPADYWLGRVNAHNVSEIDRWIFLAILLMSLLPERGGHQ